MGDTPQQFNGGEYVDKARDTAREHPDQARSAIDKVQEAVDKRTGGKFGSLIDKAGDFVEDKLGLPEEEKDPDESAPKDDTSEPAEEPQAKTPDEGQSEDSSGGDVLPD